MRQQGVKEEGTGPGTLGAWAPDQALLLHGFLPSLGLSFPICKIGDQSG